MYGKLKVGFEYIDIEHIEGMDVHHMLIFKEGEIVEIIKELVDVAFASGKGYLILTDKLYATTIDSDFVEILGIGKSQ